MTATDELRRLLDERGVEWGNCIGPFPQTAYNVGNVVWQVKELVAGLDVSTRYLTPEQAVEATLGRGTCRFKTVIDQDPSRRHRGNICECSECGYRCAQGFIEDERFRYCPNCGRRVIV